MSDSLSVIESFRKNQEDIRTASELRAYCEITDSMGPSEQLIAFVNYDKSIGSTIGLEGFDNFSTSTKHELIRSTINPDKADQIATEGFVDACVKYRRWLLVGGFFILPLWIGAAVGYANKGDAVKTMKYKSFTMAYDNAESNLSKFERMISDFPTTKEASAWEAFSTKISQTEESEDEVDESEAGIKSAGWTPTNFSKATVDLKALDDKFTQTRKDLSTKVDTISKLVGDDKVTSQISSATSKTMAFAHMIEKNIRLASKIIKSASHGFEILDKK